MNFDPELMQDFLTESGELLEQLDQDLVTLETTPTDPDLLNKVFRALHTIKGSASFLALTNLVSVAHAAESALNAARNKQIIVDRAAMDLLLAAVDVIKRQFDDIREQRDLTAADPALVSKLTILGEGKAAAHAPTPAKATAPSVPVAVPAATPVAAGAASAAPGSLAAGASSVGTSAPPANSTGGDTPAGEQPLNLPPGKAELLEFLVLDVEQSLEQVQSKVTALGAEAGRGDAAAGLAETAGALSRSVEFFDFASMGKLVALLTRIGASAGVIGSAQWPRVIELAQTVVGTLREQSDGLKRGVILSKPTQDAWSQLEAIMNTADASATVAAHPSDNAAPEAATPAPAGERVPAAATPTTAPAAPVAAPTATTSAPAPEPAPPTLAAHAQAPHADAQAKHDKPAGDKAATADQTIRVEVGRLEALLNLVGELVLQKNRMGSLGRQLLARGLGDQDFREAMGKALGGMDRVTSDLQTAVMRTRMQPLDKLFGKYPRLGPV